MSGTSETNHERRFQAVPKTEDSSTPSPSLDQSPQVTRRGALKAIGLAAGALAALLAIKQLDPSEPERKRREFNRPADNVYIGAKLVYLKDLNFRTTPEKIEDNNKNNRAFVEGVTKINGIEIPQETQVIEVQNPLYIKGQDADGFGGSGNWIELMFEYPSGEKIRVFGFDGNTTAGAIESLGDGEMTKAILTENGYHANANGVEIPPNQIGLVRPIAQENN